MTRPMKSQDRVIYFAGSIRGGRDDAVIYAQLIEKLKEFGRVPTEHCADQGLIVNALSDVQ
jgi:2'-deoxynucleoside 5'-phosphate N-hydrolase